MFLVAVVAAGLALGARFLLDPVLGDHLPYATFFVAVALVTWRANLGASLLTAALGFLASTWFFIPPRLTPEIVDARNATGTVLYFAVALSFVGFGHALQRNRRCAEEVARERDEERERLHVTLSGIGDAVIATDTQGRVTFLNPVACALTGWNAGEAQGQPLAAVFRIVNEQSRQAVENPVGRVLREGTIVGLANHTLLIARDGRETPVADSAAPIRDRSGEIAGVVLVFRDRTAERAAQAALRAGEERARQALAELQNIYDQSPIGLLQLDAGLHYVRVNEQLAAMNGLPAAEHLGKTLFEIVPDLAPKVEARFRRVLATGVPTLNVELRGETAADPGVTHTWLESSFPLRDGAGKVAGLNIVVQDITERKGHEQRLAEQARLLDLTNDAIIVRDAADRITYWNRGAEQLYGYSSGEALGRNKFELLQPRFSDPLESILAKLECDGAWQGEVIHTCKNGCVITVESRWALDRDAEGRRTSILATLNDITARKSVEDALRETSRNFQTLADNIAQLAWMAEPDGDFFWYNQRWFEFTGTTLADMGGWGWEKVQHPEHLERVMKKWRAHLQNGEPWEDTFPLRGRDGDYRWFLSRALPIRDDCGRVLRWFGTNTDITELRAAREQAEAASRAKDNFLAQLSHELRTPLTPVLMAATALRDDDKLTADARAQLAMMARNVALEARLIDDLLDLTRIARGKLSLRSEPCDLHSLLGNVVEIIREDAREKEITIELDLAAPHHYLTGDPARLQQIFWNLLRNAVKFTPAGGRVRLRTRDCGRTRDEREGRGGCLRVEVNDDGIGFDPASSARLFQPFEQADGPRFGGLGLGLAIAHALTDLHGGTISASSPGKGQGATFTVELPGAVAPPAGAAGAGGAAVETAPEPPLRLLLVEDHKATREVLGRLLEKAGHHVFAARTVAEARAAAGREHFDAVISDLGLPDGTGVELMAHLRDRYGMRGIALSGYGMDEDLRRSSEAGFALHLVKPIDAEELRRALRSLVDRA